MLNSEHLTKSEHPSKSKHPNKVALITGASRGIGAAIAQALGQAGFVVIGTATSEAGAAAISERLKQNQITGKGVILDVSKTETIQSTLATIEQEFGAPLIVINNAGITQDNIVLRMKPEQWEKVLQTNLHAVFYLTKACLKPMVKAHWGRIVNITSVVACMGNWGQANYVAAKAGLIGFSKSLAQEVAGFGITVNCVAPGFIETDMTNALNEKQKEAIFTRIPMRRMGQATDIANAVNFLASDLASYITGETLHVNGGMY